MVLKERYKSGSQDRVIQFMCYQTPNAIERIVRRTKIQLSSIIKLCNKERVGINTWQNIKVFCLSWGWTWRGFCGLKAADIYRAFDYYEKYTFRWTNNYLIDVIETVRLGEKYWKNGQVIRFWIYSSILVI